MSAPVGNENYDWEVLENSSNYKGGYSSSDPTIRMFWEVFHELPLEEKKKFMLFLTGTDRIPIQGLLHHNVKCGQNTIFVDRFFRKLRKYLTFNNVQGVL